jgi:hypothetical protein
MFGKEGRELTHIAGFSKTAGRAVAGRAVGTEQLGRCFSGGEILSERSAARERNCCCKTELGNRLHGPASTSNQRSRRFLISRSAGPGEPYSKAQELQGPLLQTQI